MKHGLDRPAQDSGQISMADNENNTGTARAEKAYEAAVSATPVNAKAPVAATSSKPATPAAKEAKAEPVSPSQPQPVKTEPVSASQPKPVKAESAPASQAQPLKAEPAPQAKTATSVEPAPSAKPVKAAPKAKAPVRRKAAVKAKPAPKPKAAPAVRAKRKPAASAAPAKTAAARTVAAKPVVPVLKTAKKTAGKKQSIFAGLFRNFLPEEKTMNMSANFAGIQEAMTEAQAKAKAAFEKSSSVLGEVTDFTKGNFEAVMESGKILAEGIQGIGSELVAEGRSNFEAMSVDIKELAAAKSPTDFFKVQGDMMRKNIDSVVASGAKNSEVMLKLMSDAMAPISGRVSLAMEKVRPTSN
jgi:hypothetical protein